MNLGSIYKDLGDLDQALASTLKSLELKPDNSIAHMNLGSIHKDLGNLDQALASTLKSLELKPDNPDGLINLGSLYRELGELDQALSSTLKSLELKPENLTALMNLGGIYKDLGDLDQALASTLKSLELNPHNAAAYSNLGVIYKELGDLDQALASTDKSLELNPDNAAAYCNLGVIYKELGDLNQALSSTLKSLELKPDNPDAHMNQGMTYEILYELENALESYTKSAKLLTQYREESSLTSLISASIILLQLDRVEEAKATLSSAIITAINEESSIKRSSTRNQKNNHAYLNFLSRLLPEIPRIEYPSDGKILHLGESHCLSFTNKTIEFNRKRYIIKPRLVKGCKAFHLGEKSKTNIHKTGYEKRLQQDLNEYDYIFHSFGEIDCRGDEGIIPYCHKTGGNLKDIARTTATRYFEWTSSSLSRVKDKLIYFGTPAPIKSVQDSDESLKHHKQRIVVIKEFNTALEEQCKKSGILFADVFKLTAGEDGYNNNNWMIDTIHLKPNAIIELMKTLRA